MTEMHLEFLLLPLKIQMDKSIHILSIRKFIRFYLVLLLVFCVSSILSVIMAFLVINTCFSCAFMPGDELVSLLEFWCHHVR